VRHNFAAIPSVLVFPSFGSQEKSRAFFRRERARNQF
jgi:hypothetical protein